MDSTAPDAAMGDYLRFHEPRFDYVLHLLAVRVQTNQRILDIGWSQLTNRIHEELRVAVDALGFDADGPIPSGRYYHFDLNECQQQHLCRRDLPMYDAIVFAEVLEHLHTSPALVLQFLVELLKPGGLLVIQTPNAVALPRRIKMLLGRNPFELIRDDATNPGHFREYTASELGNYAATVGLDVETIEIRSYFDYRFAHHGATTFKSREFGRIKNLFYPLLPSTLRPGLTAILRRPIVARRAA
jgi:SAM-dependent methyltransferase